jgi:hypothetical protein
MQHFLFKESKGPSMKYRRQTWKMVDSLPPLLCYLIYKQTLIQVKNTSKKTLLKYTNYLQIFTLLTHSVVYTFLKDSGESQFKKNFEGWMLDKQIGMANYLNLASVKAPAF